LPRVDRPPEDLGPLAGSYEQPYATLDIRVTGQNIEGRITTHSPYSEQQGEQTSDWFLLRPVGDDRFVFEEGELRDSQLKFWRADGAVRFAQLGGRLYVPGSWDNLRG
jgi:hypothetical protein